MMSYLIIALTSVTRHVHNNNLWSINAHFNPACMEELCFWQVCVSVCAWV